MLALVYFYTSGALSHTQILSVPNLTQPHLSANHRRLTSPSAAPAHPPRFSLTLGLSFSLSVSGSVDLSLSLSLSVPVSLFHLLVGHRRLRSITHGSSMATMVKEQLGPLDSVFACAVDAMVDWINLWKTVTRTRSTA
ncbi:hypothetical protein CsSME_00023860 [Camellia sinensis var. sinensis]